MNSFANSSSGFNNNMNSGQSYNSTGEDNPNMNMNNMNWVPSLSWPSSLISPNLQMNSLIIKALQLGNYRQREATSTSENYCFLPQGISNLGADFYSNFQAAAAAASSSKVLESLDHHQQQQEQPFNLDSINW